MQRKWMVFGALAIFGAFAEPAVATQLVVNGSFEQTSLTSKGKFLGVVTGWTGGPSLTYVAFPGTAATGPFPAYPGLAPTSPDGGNFIEQDGDPSYNGAFSQVITGLTPGANYDLTFYQAAGQQNNFKGATTERWKVTFGAQTLLSRMFSLDQGGTGAWEVVSMQFLASTVSQALSFLAVGTPAGAPPISFLDGVSMTAVPEPASIAVLAVGVAGLAGLRRRRALPVQAT